MTRKDDIAEAAFALFAERGYAEVRMDAVADRAGVAKGTVYLHFESKEALFRAVVARKLEPAIAAMDSLTGPNAPPGAPALHALYEELAAVIDSGAVGTLLRLLVAEAPRFPELAETHFRTIVQPMTARLQTLLANGAVAGAWQTAAVRDYPMVLIAPVLMAALYRLLFEDMAPLDTAGFLEAFADLALHGLEPSGGSR